MKVNIVFYKLSTFLNCYSDKICTLHRNSIWKTSQIVEIRNVL